MLVAKNLLSCDPLSGNFYLPDLFTLAHGSLYSWGLKQRSPRTRTSTRTWTQACQACKGKLTNSFIQRACSLAMQGRRNSLQRPVSVDTQASVSNGYDMLGKAARSPRRPANIPSHFATKQVTIRTLFFPYPNFWYNTDIILTPGSEKSRTTKGIPAAAKYALSYHKFEFETYIQPSLHSKIQ